MKGVNFLANELVRAAARNSGVYLWEVALVVGITDSNFSRKLRVELPADEQARLISIIANIKEARTNGSTSS